MTQHYDLDWLKAQVASTATLEYIYFWGHSNPQNEPADKFIFSQWYPSPFAVEGVTYQTAEH